MCSQPLQIKSVIAKEGLKGYIYIEAFKQTHVKQAIEGIGNLRMGMWSQQVTIYLSVLYIKQMFTYICQVIQMLWFADGAYQRDDRCLKGCQRNCPAQAQNVGSSKERYLQG